MAGLPRDAADLHDAVLDLGHLHLEQPLEQPGMCAADDDLRALHAAANLGDVRLEALAIAVRLGGDPFRLWPQLLELPKIEQRVEALRLVDAARDENPLPPPEVLIGHLALCVA